jgi:ankyrin repeat protein
MDVKTAIDTGDLAALRSLLAEDPARANELIHWGRCTTHPLHYVSDAIFNHLLSTEKAPPLVDALIDAGADLDFQNGKETALIGAASLGAEDVGIQLADAGADPHLRGLFGETALHWAAIVGLDRLAARLIPGADLNLKDERYHATPLGWAVHGWSDKPAGSLGRHLEVVALLIAAGAVIEPYLVESNRDHPEIAAALNRSRA